MLPQQEFLQQLVQEFQLLQLALLLFVPLLQGLLPQQEFLQQLVQEFQLLRLALLLFAPLLQGLLPQQEFLLLVLKLQLPVLLAQ